ncbi:MAG: hypothetical protein AAB403_00070 [Planctomycetota bacterium]
MLKEENHASIANRGAEARRRIPAAEQIVLSRLWETLPEATRRCLLTTLSRMVAQQLPLPPSREEVRHEDR